MIVIKKIRTYKILSILLNWQICENLQHKGEIYLIFYY